MRIFQFSTLIIPCLCCLISPIHSDETQSSSITTTTSEVNIQKKSFTPFTGQVTKPKVRLRLQPTYDGQILRELNPGEMVVVMGETEDFFAIVPPADFNAYIYRTFVLDNVVEGSRVNVRLKPDLEAPILAQLAAGTPVNGKIDPNNSKWIQMAMPDTVRFYIAKEYVKNIGDSGLMARLEKKREDVNHLLSTTESVSKSEMAKPFDQINLNGIKANYQHIILDYPEFPEVSAKAKELLVALQEEYINKKMIFIDQQANAIHSNLNENQKLNDELSDHKSKIAYLEKQIANRGDSPVIVDRMNDSYRQVQMPLNMSFWLPIEENYYRQWAQNHDSASMQDFYEAQRNEEGIVVRGLIEPYNPHDPYKRSIKNKPGDYMLVNPVSKLPIAFLYSTQINLQESVGHIVSIVVVPRPNNNFAYKAYYVLSFE